MAEVSALVVANGLDEIEHDVVPPESPGGPYGVYVEGFGQIAVGWHPVFRCYMALMSRDRGEDVEPEVTQPPVQDHPDGSVEVRLVGHLGNTIGVALWMRGLPRFPAWVCRCGQKYPTLDDLPCEVCGGTGRVPEET